MAAGASLVTTADPRSRALATRIESCVFWLAASVLAVVPITFSTAVYRTYSLPRFSVLVIASSILFALLLLIAAIAPGGLAILKSRQVVLVALYFLVIAVSSIFGVARYVSVLGSYENQMGLVTHVCFLICLMALVVGIGSDTARFQYVLWAMAGSGLLTALYAVAQSAGFDPFVSSRLYTYRTGADSLVRAIGSIGHADFLGNFLLYTALLSAGLALASKGRARRIALAGAGVSVAAIALSGTRGAWVGLVAGAALFGILVIRDRPLKLMLDGRSRIREWLLALVVVAALAILIGLSPASSGVAARAKSFISDRLTGAGRTVLWRDSLRAAPHYALIGCGPEGFRKAFLPYKSTELARVSGRVQNESSHNSYLDAAISYGVPGAVLYVALIVSTLGLLVRARRLATDQTLSVMLTGVLASFVAVLVHKLFIFDLIPTGLYFFAFVALAISASNLSAARRENRTKSSPDGDRSQASNSGHRAPTSAVKVWATGAVGMGIVCAAAWYSGSLIRADMEIKRALESAAGTNYDSVLRHGGMAISAPDPAGEYHFFFARALADYATKARPAAKAPAVPNSSGGSTSAAIDLGIAEAAKAIDHSSSPDSAYVLLCYLASAKEDYTALLEDATEALKWDPHYAPAHSFLAEAYLAQGDTEGAVREVAAWMDLRTRGKAGNERQRQNRVRRFIDRGSALAERGRPVKARLEMLKGSLAAGDCTECHRSVAIAFESVRLNVMAIREWERFIDLTPGSAEADEAARRIDSLKRTSSAQTLMESH